MGPEKTYFEIRNHTGSSARLTVEIANNYDWNGISRPDGNLHGKTLAAKSSTKKRQEINPKASSHVFTLGLEFSSGHNLALRIDQGLATTKAQDRMTTAARGSGSHHAEEMATVATLIQLLAEREGKGTLEVSGSSYYDVYHQVDNRTLIVEIYESSKHPRC